MDLISEALFSSPSSERRSGKNSHILNILMQNCSEFTDMNSII